MANYSTLDTKTSIANSAERARDENIFNILNDQLLYDDPEKIKLWDEIYLVSTELSYRKYWEQKRVTKFNNKNTIIFDNNSFESFTVELNQDDLVIVKSNSDPNRIFYVAVMDQELEQVNTDDHLGLF